jgi:gliding motility-associated-like protein
MKRSGKLFASAVLMFTLCVQTALTFGQATILISQSGTVAVNDGDMFYDAGGASGVDGNTNYTITLVPAVAGQSICLDFTSFNTYYSTWDENGDSLSIFDGSNISTNKIATLRGNYGADWGTGSNVGWDANGNMPTVTSPGIFCSTNANGSLTLSFNNFSTTTSPGWVARVGTYTPLGSPGCNINLTANPNPVCSGASVTLTAIGDIVTAAINNNFNGSTVGTGWQGTSSATFQTNVCSSPSLDNSFYLWMANAACPRTLTSNAMDVSNGGTVSFEYRQASINSAASPCESPDINMSSATPEAVLLQYSINGGIAWTTMKVMFPYNMNNINASADYYPGTGYEVTKWNKIVVPITGGAMNASTMFRWYMPLCTSASTDNWGLDNVVIGSPKAMTITLKDVTNNIVLGTSTTSPYNFTVTPSATTTYMATISDGTTSCTSQVVVTVNPCGCVTPTAEAGPTQVITCSTTTATLNGTGSSTGANYTYNWSASGGGNIVSGATTINPVVNQPGIYTLTVTNTTGGCTATDNVVITSNTTPPVASAGADQTICSGQSATLTATGGGTYSWSNSATSGSTSVTPASTNTYTVTVTSATNGCTASDNVVVNVTAMPTANAGADQTICPSQSATLTASGGSSYAWSTGGNTASITISPSSSSTYIVTVSNGTCSATDNVVVTVAASIFANAGADQTICPSQSATLTANGGSTYAWNTGINTASIIVTPASTTTYTVTVSNGTCSATDNVVVNVASAVTANAGTDQTICPASSATLSAGGGTAYSWSNGTNTPTITVSPATTTIYTVTVSNGTCSATDNVTVNVAAAVLAIAGPDQAICPSSSATLTASGGTLYTWNTGANTASITVSPASTTIYTVTVSNGTCSATDAVVVSISNNASILLTPANSSICSGASVVLSASGVSNYTWSPASSLSSSTGNSVTATPASTTAYTVTGTNGTGCTGSATITINVAPITATAASTSESCGQSNGTVTVNASGPCTGGFTYLWNTPSQQTMQNVSGLPAGAYSVTVNCGACTTTATTTVGFIAGPTVSCTALNSSCGNANGNANASPSGGSGPYSYIWSTAPAQATQTMVNVMAGTYTVTVTDANTCTTTGTVTITDIPGPSATAAMISSDSCNRSNGSAMVNVSGGSTPYLYSWNSTPLQNTQTLSNVAAGTYTATITDASGCSDTAIVVITSISGPVVTMSSANETCGQVNGTATAVATQGSGNYTYIWNTIPAQTTQSVTNLAAGTYTVTVYDGICSVVASITLNNIEGPDADMIIYPQVVNTLNGLVNFTSQTSANIASCAWDYGDGTYGSGIASQHEYQNIGTYIVTMTITDSYGCTLIATDTVIVKDIFTLYIPNAFTPDNDGLNDLFYPVGLNIDPTTYIFEIYDRWGKVVFSTTKLDDKWNGTYFNNGKVPDDCKIGVYVYRIVAHEVKTRERVYVGKVTLVK